MLALLLVVLPVLVLASLTTEAARRVLGAWLVGSAAGVMLEVVGVLVLGPHFAQQATGEPFDRAGMAGGFTVATGGYLLGCFVAIAVAVVTAPVVGCQVFQFASPRQRRPAAVGAVLGGLLALAFAVILGVAASLSHELELSEASIFGCCSLVTLGAVVGWSLAPLAGTVAEARCEPAVHAAGSG